MVPPARQPRRQDARGSRDLIFVAGEVAERLDHGDALDDVSLGERLLTNVLIVLVTTAALPVVLSMAMVVFLLCRFLAVTRRGLRRSLATALYPTS